MPRLTTADLAARYLCGASLAVLSQVDGRSIPTIHRYLRAAGVKMRRRGRARGTVPRRADTDEILAKVDAGRALSDIAAEHGVTHQRISQIMHKHGRRRDHVLFLTVAVAAARERSRKRREKAALAKHKIKEMGVAKRAAKQAAKVKRATAARVAGATWRDIAAKERVSPMAILRLCIAHDPSLRTRPYKPRGATP